MFVGFLALTVFFPKHFFWIKVWTLTIAKKISVINIMFVNGLKIKVKIVKFQYLKAGL